VSETGRVERARTLAELMAALDARPSDPEGFDQRIWQELGTEGAVLVTDLTGFTRSTREHGILHFLSIFRRCEQACVPLVGAHGGRLVKQKADDLIAVFPRVGQALDSAIEMLQTLRRLNQTLPSSDQVGMCVGLEYGRYLALEDDAFGDPVNIAFKLGEDVAEREEILIGPNAWRKAREDGFDFTRFILDGPRRCSLGNVELEHHSLKLGG
jgi:class 3 adenylate cyclase